MTWENAERTLADARTGSRSLVIGIRIGQETRRWCRGELPDGERSNFEIGSVTKVVTATLLAEPFRLLQLRRGSPRLRPRPGGRHDVRRAGRRPHRPTARSGGHGLVVPVGAEQHLARGHGWLGRPRRRWDLAGLAGAGGLVSTADDLLTFLHLHSPGNDSVLARAAAESARPRYAVNRMMRMGLGWTVLPGGEGPARARLAHDVLMHDGGTGGYRSFAAVAPATGTAVVVLSGRARSTTGPGLRLVRAVL